MAAYYLDALLSGSYWNGGVFGTGITVTYGFATSVPSYVASDLNLASVTRERRFG